MNTTYPPSVRLACTVHRRTFEAAKHPAGSAERARLNLCALTSQYMTGSPYLARYPFRMSDGTPHPTQSHISREFRTRSISSPFQTRIARWLFVRRQTLIAFA